MSLSFIVCERFHFIPENRWRASTNPTISKSFAAKSSQNQAAGIYYSNNLKILCRDSRSKPDGGHLLFQQSQKPLPRNQVKTGRRASTIPTSSKSFAAKSSQNGAAGIYNSNNPTILCRDIKLKQGDGHLPFTNLQNPWPARARISTARARIGTARARIGTARARIGTARAKISTV